MATSKAGDVSAGMKPPFVTVTCFDPQPREWFTTVNTIGFDHVFGLSPWGEALVRRAVPPPYDGRYATELCQPNKTKKK